MKTTFSLIAGLLLLLPAGLLHAQKKNIPQSRQSETIVIRPHGSGETLLEIKAEGLFLNGEKIASREDLSNRNFSSRIIIRGTDFSDSLYSDYEDYFRNFSQRKGSSGNQGFLGVFTDINKEGTGASVLSVSPGSAAEKAGLQEGDLIEKVDEQEVLSAAGLSDIIKKYHSGDQVTIQYKRNGKNRQTTAVLGPVRSRPEVFPFGTDQPFELFPPRLPEPFPFYDRVMPGNRAQIGILVEEDADGSLNILEVKPRSAAEKGGMEPGDKITYINDRKVNTIEALQAQLAKIKPGENLKVEIERKGKRETKYLVFPDRKKSRSF